MKETIVPVPLKTFIEDINELVALKIFQFELKQTVIARSSNFSYKIQIDNLNHKMPVEKLIEWLGLTCVYNLQEKALWSPNRKHFQTLSVNASIIVSYHRVRKAK